MKYPDTIGIPTKHIGQYLFDGWIECIKQMAVNKGKIISDRQAYAYLRECIANLLVGFADSAQWPDLLGYDYVD